MLCACPLGIKLHLLFTLHFVQLKQDMYYLSNIYTIFLKKTSRAFFSTPVEDLLETNSKYLGNKLMNNGRQ